MEPVRTMFMPGGPARMIRSRQNESFGLAGGLACILIIPLGVNILHAPLINNFYLSSFRHPFSKISTSVSTL